MNMKKRHIFTGLLLSGLALSLVSCGKTETPEDPNQNETPGTDNPGTDNPGTDNPGTDNPGTDNPGTDNPGTDNPNPTPDPGKFEVQGISDSTTFKNEYLVGDVVNASDISLVISLKNSVSNEEKTESITDFSFSVKDSEGNTVEGNKFVQAGSYKLVLTYGTFTKELDINVKKAEFDNVTAAIAYAQSKDALVNGGTLKSKYIYSENTNEATATYHLGNNFLELIAGEDEEKQMLVYSLDNEDEGFAVMVSGSGNNKTVEKYNYSVDKEEVYGIGVDLFNNGTKDSYGALDTIIFLFDYGQEYGYDFSQKVEVVEGKTVYSYAFKIVEGEYGYEMNAEFTLGLFGNIETAKVSEKKYSNAVINTENHTFTLPETPEFTTREYEMVQTIGAKLTDSEYTYSNLAVADFKVKYGENEMTNGLVVNVDLDNGNIDVDGIHRQQYQFTITDVTPSTANSDIDKITVRVVGTAFDGTEIDMSSDEVNMDFNYVNVQTNGTIIFYCAGNYTVTFSSKSVTKTITINVSPETPSEIGIKTYENLNENSDFVDATETYEIYKSNVLYLASSIAPKLDQACVVSLPTGTTCAALVEETVKGVKAYKFTATEAGSYVVTFAAKEDPTVTNTITVNVLENPDVNNMLAGTYYTLVGTDLVTVVFNEGRVSITKGEQTQSFAYSYTNNEIVLSDSTGDNLNYNIIVNSKYKLQLVDANDNKFTLSTENPEVTTFELAGKYTGSVMNGMVSVEAEFEENNLTMNFQNVGNYTYVVESNGTITLTFVEGKDCMSNASLKIVDEKLYLVFGGNDYQLTKEGSQDVELVIPNELVGKWLGDEFDLEITTSGLSQIYFDGSYDYELTAIQNGVYTFTDVSNPSYTLEITLNGNKTITIDNAIYTKLASSDEMIGKWDFTNKGGVTTTIIVSETSILANGYEYSITSIQNGIYTYVDKTDSSYAYTLSLNNAVLTATEYIDSVEGNTINLTKRVVPNSMLGKWEYSSSWNTNTLVFDETSVLENGTFSYELTSILNGVYTFTDPTSPNYQLVIVVNENGTITATLYVSGEADPSITYSRPATPNKMIGTWVGENDTLIISENKVMQVCIDNTYEYEFTSYNNGIAVFTDVTSPSYKLYISMNEDGTLQEQSGGKYTQKEVTVHENFIGTWTYGMSSITFAANELEVEYDNFTYTITSCDATTLVMVDDTGYEMTFTYDATTGCINDGNANFTKEESSESEVTIPSGFIGTWTCDEMVLVITETSASLNNQAAQEITYNDGYLVLYGINAKPIALKIVDENTISDNTNTFTKQTTTE